MPRYTLHLEPVHDSYADILKCFNEGKPLSSQQLNFLSQYHSKISSSSFDKLLRYYKILPTIDNQTRLQKTHNLDFFSIQRLRNMISRQLDNGMSAVTLKLTPRELFQLKTLTKSEMIFFNGHQLLNGTPYFAQGIPHVDFFQWGNLFGVIKYGKLLGKNTTEANILIYFERIVVGHNLEQCIHYYYRLHPRPQNIMNINLTKVLQNVPEVPEYIPRNSLALNLR